MRLLTNLTAGMKKMIMLAVFLVFATSLCSSANAWSPKDLVLNNYYWLKYNGDVGTENYYTTHGNYKAASINVLIDDAVGSAHQKSLASDVWLGNVNTFCIDLNTPFTTNEYAAKYMDLPTIKGAAYLLNKYIASDTDFAWNAALQAAVWKAIDPTHEYQLWSGPTSSKLAAAQGFYTSFVTEIAGLSGYGLTPGFNGSDPINNISQNVGTGLVADSSLGDFVWEDTNNNGIQDDGELGIAGVGVHLLDSNSIVIKSVVTNTNGYYSFTNIVPGTYKVQFNLLDAYLFSPQNQGGDITKDSDADSNGLTGSVTLAPGENNVTIDAGLVPASLGDFVWNDLNGNGIQDNGEPGIMGITVDLLGADGITIIATTTTDDSGYYNFPKLIPGDYYVKFGILDTYTFTKKGSTITTADDSNADMTSGITDKITLGPGEINMTIDAGMYLPGSIGDFVWNDRNNDGVQDSGEPGIPGVTVNLLDADGNIISSTTTDANGEYDFSKLPAGNYTVKIDTTTLPAGLTKPTYDLDGIGSANSAATALAAGQDRVDVDFGYTGTGSIGDRVWLDKNHDGIQDSSESGIVGVTVTLTSPAGLSLTTTTAADGIYKFENLPADDYTVTIDTATLPTGLVQTYDLDGIVTASVAVAALAAGQDRTDVDFGYTAPCVKPVNINGYVYIDSNANGCLNAGEPPKAGVIITLSDASGNVVGTATTDSNGYYSFINLAPGNYHIVETVPADYVATNALPGTGGVKVSITKIDVAATTAGNTYAPQNFLITGTKPGVEITKTGPATAKVGETITYTFVVVNTGNTYLYGGVTVNDPMLGGNIWHKTPVAPGETNTFTKTYVVKSCDPECLVNTATAIGCPPIGCKVYDTSSWTTKIIRTTCSSYTTYTQGGWGSCPSGNNPGKLLADNFKRIYGCGGVIIGNCRVLKFTNSCAVKNFLPQGGTPGTLCKSYINPTRKTSAGVFAGQVLALRLNIDFSDAGITCRGLGDLKVKSGKLAGWTVDQVMCLANKVLGGNKCALPCGVSISDLNSIVTSINENFDGGKVNKGFLR